MEGLDACDFSRGTFVWHPEEEGGLWFDTEDPERAKALYANAVSEPGGAEQYLTDEGARLRTRAMSLAEAEALPEAP